MNGCIFNEETGNCAKLIAHKAGGLVQLYKNTATIICKLLIYIHTVQDIYICIYIINDTYTLGVIGPDSLAFLHDLASRIQKVTMEPLALQYLLQRLSVAIQRGNAIAIRGTAEWDSSEESPCL